MDFEKIINWRLYVTDCLTIKIGRLIKGSLIFGTSINNMEPGLECLTLPFEVITDEKFQTAIKWVCLPVTMMNPETKGQKIATEKLKEQILACIKRDGIRLLTGRVNNETSFII